MKTAYKEHFSRIHAQKRAKNPFGGWLLFLDSSKEMQNSFIDPQQKFPKQHIPSVFVNVKEIWSTVILLNIVDRIVTLLRASSQLVTDVEWERPLTGFRSWSHCASVADPDFQKKEGGGGGTVSKKTFFGPSGLSLV